MKQYKMKIAILISLLSWNSISYGFEQDLICENSTHKLEMKEWFTRVGSVFNSTLTDIETGQSLKFTAHEDILTDNGPSKSSYLIYQPNGSLVLEVLPLKFPKNPCPRCAESETEPIQKEISSGAIKYQVHLKLENIKHEFICKQKYDY